MNRFMIILVAIGAVMANCHLANAQEKSLLGLLKKMPASAPAPTRLMWIVTLLSADSFQLCLCCQLRLLVTCFFDTFHPPSKSCFGSADDTKLVRVVAVLDDATEFLGREEREFLLLILDELHACRAGRRAQPSKTTATLSGHASRITHHASSEE